MPRTPASTRSSARKGGRSSTASTPAKAGDEVSPPAGRTRSARKRRGMSEDSAAASSSLPNSTKKSSTATEGTPRRSTRSSSVDVVAETAKNTEKLAAIAASKVKTPAKKTPSVKKKTPAAQSAAKSTGKGTGKKKAAATTTASSSAVDTPRRRTRSMSASDVEDDEVTQQPPEETPNEDNKGRAVVATAKKAKTPAPVLSPVLEMSDDDGDDDHGVEADEKETDGAKEVKSDKKEKKEKSSKKSAKKSATKGQASASGSKKGEATEKDGDAIMTDSEAPGTESKRRNRRSKKKSEPTTTTSRTLFPDDGQGSSPNAGRKSKKARKAIMRAQKKDNDKDGKEDKVAEAEKPVPAKEPDRQMDVAVHRIRHLNYIPESINRLASTPLLPAGQAGTAFNSSYVAVARAGGSVELLAVDQKWRTVATVPGLRQREVDALAWVCGYGRQNVVDGNNGDGGIDEAGGDGNNGAAEPITYSSSAHEESDKIHSGRRLFGASRDGTIFEVDFRTQRHNRVTPSGGGSVCCLESLCPECVCCHSSDDKHSACGGYLAAGCEDGSVKIYRVYAEEESASSSGTGSGGVQKKMLDLVSTLPSAGSPVLSLAWRRGGANGSGSGDGLAGSVLYAGVADGTIRRYDCLSTVDIAKTSGSAVSVISTGSVLASEAKGRGSLRWRSTHRMTVETLGRRTPTKVWALKALVDGTLVSGDSLGHVHFWDGHSGTLMSKFVQNENKADVLDIAVSTDECKVFASGVDSRVIQIERTTDPSTRGVPPSSHPSESKWIQSQVQRAHTHDVKSLCICHMKDPIGSAGAKTTAVGLGRELLCSGGVDTKLSTYLVSKFRQHRSKKIFPWPSSSPISMARERRVLALMRSDKVDLYSLSPQEFAPAASSDPPGIVKEEKNFLGSIDISSLYNLVCADISSDGSLLALSDGANLMIFSLDYVMDETEEDSRELVVSTKLKLPKKSKAACSAVKFSNSDSGDRLFCASTKGPIKVLRISTANDDDDEDTESEEAPRRTVSLEHTLDKYVVSNRKGSAGYAISELAVSSNGNWLAASRFGMGSGAVLLFSTAETGDYKQWWSLPAFEAPHSCVKFLGGGDSEALVVGCSNNSFYIFDYERRCMSDWSEDAGFPVSSSLPRQLIHRAEYPTRMVFNPASPSKFFLGAHGFFCIVDLDQPVPEHCNIFPPNHVRARRFVPRKSKGGNASGDEVATSRGERKRKRSMSNAEAPQREQSGNFTICLRYSSMIFMDFVAENEMVVVEQPWMNVVSALPDALERKVYGR